MSLNTELVKHCTSLRRLTHLDDLMTRMTGFDTEVWALRAENFPLKLIPENSKDYLCYIGIACEKLNAEYGQVHFLTFGHENFNSDGSVCNDGLLEHMYDIYCETIKNQMAIDDEVYLYPAEIDNESLAYWSDIASNTWGIRDKPELKEFIKHNQLEGWVNWDALEEDLPKVYYPSEKEYDTESESETETESETESDTESESESEDGEIKQDEDEPSRKRRKLILLSEDET
jgi:hypothetical protein